MSVVEFEARSPAPYEPQEIADIMTNSFFFAKTEIEAQTSMLSRIAILNQPRFTSNAMAEALPLAQNDAYKIVTSDWHLPVSFDRGKDPEEVIYGEVKTYFDALSLFIEDPALAAKSATLLTGKLVNADRIWLPRLRHTEPKRRPPKPYSSNLVRFGFLAADVKRPEFREIFAHAAEELVSSAGNTLIRHSIVPEIVATHYNAQTADRPEMRKKIPPEYLELSLAV